MLELSNRKTKIRNCFRSNENKMRTTVKEAINGNRKIVMAKDIGLPEKVWDR